MSTKITGLSALNVQALDEIGCQLHELGVEVSTTQTTATFTANPELVREYDAYPGRNPTTSSGIHAAIAAGCVRAVLLGLPGRSHPKASLHAVVRRLHAAGQ